MVHLIAFIVAATCWWVIHLATPTNKTGTRKQSWGYRIMRLGLALLAVALLFVTFDMTISPWEWIAVLLSIETLLVGIIVFHKTRFGKL